VDSKQQKFIRQLFAGGVEMDEVASLDRLTDRVAIARPQLDGLPRAPPLDAKDTILRLLSTFPQRSKNLCPLDSSFTSFSTPSTLLAF